MTLFWETKAKAKPQEMRSSSRKMLKRQEGLPKLVCGTDPSKTSARMFSVAFIHSYNKYFNIYYKGHCAS